MPDGYPLSVIEGDREVIEDAEADDMFVAERDDKSGYWLNGTYLNSTPIYRGLNLSAIGECPALIRVSSLSLKNTKAQ